MPHKRRHDQFMQFYTRTVGLMRDYPILLEKLESLDVLFLFKGINSLYYTSPNSGVPYGDFEYAVYIHPDLPDYAAVFAAADAALRRSNSEFNIRSAVCPLNFFRDTAATKVGHFNMYRGVGVVVSLFHMEDHESMTFWEKFGGFDVDFVDDPDVGGVLTMSRDATVRDMKRIVFEYDAYPLSVRENAARCLAILGEIIYNR
jgi:hypothetical protein